MTSSESVEKYRRLAITFAAILGGGLIAVAALYFIYLIRGALPPFIYAAIIVYLARPFVEMLAYRRVPRLMAVLIAYLIVFSLITLVMLFVVPILIQQIEELVVLFPKALKAFEQYVSELRLRLPLGVDLDSIVAAIQEQSTKVAVNVASNLPRTAIGLFGGIFDIVLGWLLAFYILKDLPAINETFLELLPKAYRKNVLHVFREVDFAVGGYLRGQVIVSLTVGIMITAWLVFLGVDFALLLGLMSGVLNIIPYFGAIVGGTAAVIVAMSHSTHQAILVIIGIAIIQQIDGLIVSPAVMRHTVNLHPTVVVFSLLVGASLFGFFGLIFAIPLAAALKAILLHYVFARPVEPAEAVEES
jgi:predicted PurR-regulated permease PerM